ncbi:hypothetical protein E3N88_42171 [Mikania micrantha]|uniref:LOB domain-containing protein n=1 Tax=Mikania micrantha TaxID=192012 RepID=A0A5N6LIH2_9ASTR|nr:hypothetical protein E3N88_42171 [Mikania micrantha]
MSCNGCRILRKGCSDKCILRPCLQWIDSPEAQAHATLFVAKFFGRAGLMSFISSVPQNQRPSLFQSLLFEAAGRTVNPVNGAVGLLWTGNWHVCQASVDTVLRGGTLRPIPELLHGHSILPNLGEINKLNDLLSPSNTVQTTDLDLNQNLLDLPEILRQGSPSINSDDSFVTTMCLDCDLREIDYGQDGREAHLLNLFK